MNISERKAGKNKNTNQKRSAPNYLTQMLFRP